MHGQRGQQITSSKYIIGSFLNLGDKQEHDALSKGLSPGFTCRELCPLISDDHEEPLLETSNSCLSSHRQPNLLVLFPVSTILYQRAVVAMAAILNI